jgi:hypothetical protein
MESRVQIPPARLPRESRRIQEPLTTVLTTPSRDVRPVETVEKFKLRAAAAKAAQILTPNRPRVPLGDSDCYYNLAISLIGVHQTMGILQFRKRKGSRRRNFDLASFNYIEELLQCLGG